MKRLMWGEARAAIATQKNDGSGYDTVKTLPSIVENALQLQTTKGGKQDATVEGGRVEAVRYKANTYGLEIQIRTGVENGESIKLPFDEIDGIVDGIWGLRVQPEDPETGGLTVMETVISVEDTFTAQDGAIWKITFDFISPLRKADGTKVPTIDWSPIPNLTAAFEATPKN